MRTELIRSQHLYLKLAIFAIGISIALEASLKQLGMQTILLLIYFSFDHRLYHKVLFALIKMLSFFAAYWILAIFAGIEFPQAVIFSSRIVYLILLTVSVWAAINPRRLLGQCIFCRKVKIGQQFTTFFISTYLFIRKYFVMYQALDKSESISGILDRAILAGQKVHAQSSAIEARAEELQKTNHHPTPAPAANLYGLTYLCLMVIISSI